jgi:hypothetical protein
MFVLKMNGRQITCGYCIKYFVRRARILGSSGSAGEDLSLLGYVAVSVGK